MSIAAASVLDAATAALRTGLSKADANLSPAQGEVIRALMEGQRDVLYIDRTGAGKSETYFITATLMRQRNKKAGPVIVVTPMIALMHDQERRGRAFGLKAAAYYSEKKGMSQLAASNVRMPLRRSASTPSDI
jgi:ATP-dependent DNA helicase RecQ